MPDFTFALNQSIPFTGTSDTTGDEGVYTDLASVEAHYDHPGGPLVLEFFGFNLTHPTGPSWMGLDLRLKVRGGSRGVYQRFTDREANAMRFSLVDYEFVAGRYIFGIEARSVLLNGPPIAVQVGGTATLRLRTQAQARVLAFSIQQPQIIEAEQQWDVIVNACWPQDRDIRVKLEPIHPGIVASPLEQPIPYNQRSATFQIRGDLSQNNYLKASSNGFEPPVPLKIKVHPVISEINPANGKAGDKFTIAGKGFVPGSRVVLNYMPCDVHSHVDRNQMTVYVPANLSPGTHPVYVEVDGLKSPFLYKKVEGQPPRQVVFNIER